MNKNYNKWFLSKVKKAIQKYNLIEPDDTVAVGLSGGKDSTALLYILWHLQNFSHLNFKLFGVHIAMGWENADISDLTKLCQKLNIPLIIENAPIAQAIMPEGELISNPCSLCSRLRRGALSNLAKKEGIKKIALGHHSDDIAETLFLNILQGGKFKAFPPRIDYADKGISIIRPLIYLEEKTLEAICRLENLPVIASPCPAEDNTKRQQVKKLLRAWQAEYLDFNSKIIHALENIEVEDLW